eukprot:g5508.t1
MFAALHNQASAMHALLRAGARIDAVESFGRTALHCCALIGELKGARMLVARGANRRALDKDGKTAADCFVEAKCGADEAPDWLKDGGPVIPGECSEGSDGNKGDESGSDNDNECDDEDGGGNKDDNGDDDEKFGQDAPTASESHVARGASGSPIGLESRAQRWETKGTDLGAVAALVATGQSLGSIMDMSSSGPAVAKPGTGAALGADPASLGYQAKPQCPDTSDCGKCVETKGCGFCGDTKACLSADDAALRGACTDWQQDVCMDQPCKMYRDCTGCLADPVCGWCAITNQCMEDGGSGRGPVGPTCGGPSNTGWCAVTTSAELTAVVNREKTLTGRAYQFTPSDSRLQDFCKSPVCTGQATPEARERVRNAHFHEKLHGLTQNTSAPVDLVSPYAKSKKG